MSVLHVCRQNHRAITDHHRSVLLMFMMLFLMLLWLFCFYWLLLHDVVNVIVVLVDADAVFVVVVVIDIILLLLMLFLLTFLLSMSSCCCRGSLRSISSFSCRKHFLLKSNAILVWYFFFDSATAPAMKYTEKYRNLSQNESVNCFTKLFTYID